jgi:nanoRNase/pAp phosphatase (c-di-AMP/oligoRNAs hydrolase)
MERLVLGSGSLVHTLVEQLQNQSGTVCVGTDDGNLATSLQEEGIEVQDCVLTDPDALAQFDPEFVVITAGTRQEILDSTRAAREAFPGAYLLVYTGHETGVPGLEGVETSESAYRVAADSTALDDHADRVVDLARAATDNILDQIGESGRQMRQLWGIFRDIERLAVVTHDNPDPDAIASGIALARLGEAAGCEAHVCYYGDITHQENRAFVNVLDLELHQFDHDESIDEYDGIALVDHSRPGVNDQLPEDSQVDIVIDHHPPRAPVNARFVDLRSGVGATSTLLVDYLDRLGLGFDRQISTALLFGIHVDTHAFTREVSQIDFEAAARLVPTADLGILERIESPSMSGSTLETVARAIQNRRIEGEVLLSCVGRLSERDALAQAADRLLMLDDVSTTMVYGVMDGTIFVSARSRGADIDIGESLRAAFDQIGSAGGHVHMAGAQITLGILDAVEDRDESIREIVEDVVEDRFLEAIEAHTTRTVTNLYTDLDGDQYLVDEDHTPDE